jgi:hypothetical protein
MTACRPLLLPSSTGCAGPPSCSSSNSSIEYVQVRRVAAQCSRHQAQWCALLSTCLLQQPHIDNQTVPSSGGCTRSFLLHLSIPSILSRSASSRCSAVQRISHGSVHCIALQCVSMVHCTAARVIVQEIAVLT